MPCDVTTYATGLRNIYDFAWHSNGNLYATDNGNGVTSTFPDLAPNDLAWSPGDGCLGPVNGTANVADHNPGNRHDLLLNVVEDGYYGHPNPSRDECVFYGGNPTAGNDFPVQRSSDESQAFRLDIDQYDVGVQPEPNFVPAMFSFGRNHSVNGLIEYRGGAFCGSLRGDLLAGYFSSGDQIRRVQLSPDGSTVVSDEALIRSTSGTGGTNLQNPLPITQDAFGRIYVGEFVGGRIAVFDPIPTPCWQSEGIADLPDNRLDAAGAAIEDRLYVVGGKTPAGHHNTLFVYDGWTNSWSSGPTLPAGYPGVENAASAVHDGKLYVFGGSTAPFSGAVANAAVYDPATGAWSSLTSMPTARGGATAATVGGSVYVVGGMTADGRSSDVVEVYDVVTDTWSTGTPLPSPRDNPMVVALGTDVYSFGGRIMGFGATDGTLTLVDKLDTTTGVWSPQAALPTGRRTGNVVVLDGDIYVLGGERTAGGDTFSQVEIYDPATNTWTTAPDMPAGRHGAVAGVIQGRIFVASGGTTGGSSFTDDVVVFNRS